MPTVAINRDALFRALGKDYTDEEFDELCFQFGIELDEITSEKQMARKQDKESSTQSDEVVYKIDIPANRYDLLCLEGLSRALRIFLGQEAVPKFTVKKVNKPLVMKVKAETKQIRPFVVCAVLRNLTLDHLAYNSFLDLQEKLHQNLCRRRTLVAIGTHDLDTIQGPFSYEARAPKDISFVPLNQTEEVTAAELMEILRTDPSQSHLKPYTDIIYDSPVYPVIYDKNGRVLSLPPIINGDHSKISRDTKNCFIECTGTDLTKAKVVLNTIVAMFSEYCRNPFEVEPVIIDYGSEKQLLPDLSEREASASIKDVRTIVGVELDAKTICKLCTKMQLAATVRPGGAEVAVKVPVTRSDVLHAVDIIEDVAIAYGFNNIPKRVAPTLTVGAPDPINLLTDLLRMEISRAGYTELLTHGMCSAAENFDYLRRKNDGKSAVVLSNPATIEFEVVRTTLLPGILKTLQHNKSIPMKNGVKLFEISDVVLLDNSSDTGARNARRIAAIYSGPTAGFEVIHGLVDRILECLDVSSSLPDVPALRYGKGHKYKIVASTDSTYFPGRSANIVFVPNEGEEKIVGSFGILHPEVLANFELTYPASVVEMDLEPFL